MARRRVSPRGLTGVQLAVELSFARRHSLRSCPPRDLVESTAAERYPLGSPQNLIVLGGHMGINHSLLIAESARRGLRLQVLGFATWIALALISILGARTNPLMAMLVVLSGIGVVFIGRSLRATGTLLRVTEPPQPAWIAPLVVVTFVAGPVVSAIGLWQLFTV